jgi:hypothetical protein
MIITGLNSINKLETYKQKNIKKQGGKPNYLFLLVKH